MENITDSELRKIAENWEKEQPINIGIKTAFAAGYRMAEIKAKNCTIPDVSQQSKQLIDFINWYDNLGKDLFSDDGYDILVTHYLKSINWG